jgi:alpha-D-ribose 1-methylphosphonate 5-triphosphate synthase subunit PhnI
VPGEDATRLDVGYGLCFGDNEAKALAMAGLDLLVHRDPATDRLEQKVLIHLDGPEASGFLEHLKLPHYVDFRSTMERLQAVRVVAGGSAR